MISSLRQWGKERKLIKLLSGGEWLNDTRKASGGFGNHFPSTLVYHVDGTLIKGFKPSDAAVANALYNSKHGAHGWQIFVLVSQMGRIAYLSSVEGGKVHDKTHWEIDGVSDQLYSHYSALRFYDKGELKIRGVRYRCAVGGDKAYKRLQLPEGWKLFITKSGENHDVDAEQRAHDRGVPYSQKSLGRNGNGAEGIKKKKGKEKCKEKKLQKETESGTPLNTDMDEMQIFSPEIARFRSVVERVMKAMKRWRVLDKCDVLSAKNIEDMSSVFSN